MKKIIASTLAAIVISFTASHANAGADPLLGEITMFAGTFAPRGWALCDGQLLPINSNQALFSLLGTTYGGDGRTTFGLPDLRGRAPIHAGAGPGLPDVRQGQKSGGNGGDTVVRPKGGNGEEVTHTTVATPTQSVNFIIALVGVFPSRS